MRTWLLSNTTYGTWLPGDRRGSVTSVRDLRPEDEPTPLRFEHDIPGEPWEDEVPGLYRSALERMNGPPIYLDLEKAEALLAQFQETAGFRGWTLRAVAIMANHFHLVVEVPDDPAPRKLLADFKAYGSRTLNRRYGKPPSETWWTDKGSKRKLRDEQAVANAIHYVLYKQWRPLVVWSPEHGRIPAVCAGVRAGEPGA
jgi:REP element-mobilizing transposase RayT